MQILKASMKKNNLILDSLVADLLKHLEVANGVMRGQEERDAEIIYNKSQYSTKKRLKS